MLPQCAWRLTPSTSAAAHGSSNCWGSIHARPQLVRQRLPCVVSMALLHGVASQGTAARPSVTAYAAAADAASEVQLPVQDGDSIQVAKQQEEDLQPQRHVDEEGQSTDPSFQALGIDNLFIAGLARSKITAPAPIQSAAIPRILAGRNCAIQSFTGSGKTLAYLLPAMTLAFQRAQQLYKQHGNRAEAGAVQVLVVAPSQELCMQIVRVAQGLLPQEARNAVQQCIGGANPNRQKEALVVSKPLVVVGTPGRLAELVRMGALQLHMCPIMVLDEADQLLAPHFTEDLLHIATHCGKRVEGGRQTVTVSATLFQTVLAQLDKYSPAAEYVSLGASPQLSDSAAGSTAATTDAAVPGWGWGAKGWEGPNSTVAPRTEGSAGGAEGEQLMPTMPPNLQHVYMVVEPAHRVDALRRCMHALGAERALVFMNWQQRLKDAQFKLQANGMEVASLHGELGKLQRQQTLEAFRRGKLRALMVSDVAARGIDVSECDAVFNLELPSNAAHYAHRAGRTGRMGAPGTVVTLATPDEVFVVEKLAKKLTVPILEGHLSHGNFILGPPPPQPSSKRPKRSKQQEADSRTSRPSTQGAGNSSAAGASSLTAGQRQLPQQVEDGMMDDDGDEYDSDDDDDAPIKLPPGFELPSKSRDKGGRGSKAKGGRGSKGRGQAPAMQGGGRGGQRSRPEGESSSNGRQWPNGDAGPRQSAPAGRRRSSTR